MDQGSIDDMFSQMLGELDDLTQQLDAVPEVSNNLPPPPPPKQHLHTLEQQDAQLSDFDEEDVNLTAMLDDLCSFEGAADRQETGNGYNFDEGHSLPRPGYQPQRYNDNINQVPPPDEVKLTFTTNRFVGADVGAEDEGYSLDELSKDIDLEANPTKELTEEELALLSPEEREEREKSEKMRIALEKMKEARIQKLVVKVFNKDDSSKTMMIDERMTTRTIMKQLIEKNHYDFSPNWSLIEEMPSLYLERVFEEHEKPCEIMRHWTRDGTNQLRFVERKDKYALFKNPQHYLLTSSDQQDQMQERQKRTLIEEFFSGKGPSSGVPEVEGYLHIKNGKSWSRKYCVLRSSGLYISKSGEPKRGKKLSDLACMVMFEQTILYVGRKWKKKFKSPYEYGFALKHPAIQLKSKHIRYFACEDFKSLMRWTVGIRLAKYGVALKEDYEKTNEEMKSTSTLSMTFRHEQADKSSLRPPDSGEVNSRPNTLPRGVGVKNMFEGAWKRANQVDKADETSNEAPPGMNRVKSVWKPSQPRKTNNWWELNDEEGSGTSASLSNTADSDSTSTSRSLDDLASSLGSNLPPPGVESSLPPPHVYDDFPLPPPIDDVTAPPHFPAPTHNSPRRPPPVPTKPSFYPEESTTFTSYEDPLPPPPPSDNLLPPPPPSKVGFKLPPPIPRKNFGGSPQRNYNNNNLTPLVTPSSLPGDGGAVSHPIQSSRNGGFSMMNLSCPLEVEER